METNKINYTTLQQYLEGKLNEQSMHELEKQALDDPFLSDALDGYARVNVPAGRQLSLLQAQLEARIAQQQENKDRFHFSWQRLSIAATAGLLFVTASILFWIKGYQSDTKPSSNPRQVEVNLSSADASREHSQTGSGVAIQSQQETTSSATATVGSTMAQPVGGWPAYDNYIKNSIRQSGKNVKGSVIVVFFVTENGTPSNFKIEKGINALYNSEAIRLIKSGPRWQPGQGITGRVTISFDK